MAEKRTILFGAGLYGASALYCLGRENILCFVDNNSDKVGKYFHGMLVISFKELCSKYRTYRIIITPPKKNIAWAIAEQLDLSGIYHYQFFTDIMKLEQLDYFKRNIEITAFPTAKGYIRRLQRERWDFAKKIVRELERNQIYPFAVGGTLLGAMRHKGFIPWDDDLDFGLIRSEYESFLQFCKERYLVKFMERTHDYDRYLAQVNAVIMEHPNEIILFVYMDFIKLVCGSSLMHFNQIDIFSFDYYSADYAYESYVQDTKRIEKLRDTADTDWDGYEIVQRAIVDNPYILKAGKGKYIYPGWDNMGTYKYLTRNTDWVSAYAVFPLQKMSFENGWVWAPCRPAEYMICEYPNYMGYPDDIGVNHLPSMVNFRLEIKSLEIFLLRGDEAEIKAWISVYEQIREAGFFVRFILDKELHDIIEFNAARDCLDKYEVEFSLVRNLDCDVVLCLAASSVGMYHGQVVVLKKDGFVCVSDENQHNSCMDIRLLIQYISSMNGDGSDEVCE